MESKKEVEMMEIDFYDANLEIDQLYDTWIRSNVFKSLKEYQYHCRISRFKERNDNMKNLINFVQSQNNLLNSISENNNEKEDSCYITMELRDMLSNLNDSFQKSKFVLKVKDLHENMKERFLELTKEIEGNREKIEELFNKLERIKKEHEKKFLHEKQ